METTHTLRKLVEARRALQQRKKTLILGIFLELGIAGVLAMLLIGCAGGSSAPVAPPPIPTVQALQVVDVQNIVQAAVNSVNVDMAVAVGDRSEEHTSELQSPCNLVCRLLLEKKKKDTNYLHSVLSQ